MGFFSKFPYSNGYQLNLDWIIEKIKKFENDYNLLDPDSFLRKSGGELNGNLHVGEGGSINMGGHDLSGLKDAVNGGDAVPLRQVQSSFVKKSGDTMTGPLNMDGHTLTGLPSPVAASEAANKDYVDRKIGTPAAPGAYLPLAGGVMSGDIDMDGHELTGIQNPVGGLDAVNKTYLDGINGAIRQWASSSFAPSGYGLGVANAKETTDIDSETKNGWYRVPAANSPTTNKAVAFVSSDGDGLVEIELWDSGGLHLRSTKINGSGHWEFYNPPMKIGVEYRTTERWRGKPSYWYLIDVGVLPNNSLKSVYFNTTNVDEVYYCMGGTTSGFTLPNIANQDEYTVYTLAGKGYVNIITKSDRSAASGAVLVKYTKTTD